MLFATTSSRVVVTAMHHFISPVIWGRIHIELCGFFSKHSGFPLRWHKLAVKWDTYPTEFVVCQCGVPLEKPAKKLSFLVCFVRERGGGERG